MTLSAPVALGCMRLSEVDRDQALATIAAAIDSGVTMVDTARAYGPAPGHNERLVAEALVGRAVLVVTKGGMQRPEGAWLPDGRARSLREDAEASAEALGRPPDLWLLHAPDPRTPWRTSVRALAAIQEAGLARAVGVSNVTRTQLEEALDAAPVAAVSVALGPFDDAPLRGGVVELCAARGIAVLAHAPLGGPARAPRLAADPVLAAIAAAHGVDAAAVVRAWLRTLAPAVVPVIGARRPETARALAVEVSLRDEERERLEARFPASALARPRASRAAVATGDGEVVLIMGIPGAGKTRAVAAWTGRGYQRLNRDGRGGDLRGLSRALDEAMQAGSRRVVLDNTYVTRVARADVLEVAWRHGAPVRGVWIDTPMAQGQVNLCVRYVETFGRLPGPDELKASKIAGVMAPTQHMRLCRQVEVPRSDEGFAALEVVPFVREPDEALAPGRVIAIGGPREDGVATLAIGWRPGATIADENGDEAICVHPGGPPTCWCRPPLPGLVVAWARRCGVDLAKVTVVGPAPTFRTLAAALGAIWIESA